MRVSKNGKRLGVAAVAVLLISLGSCTGNAMRAGEITEIESSIQQRQLERDSLTQQIQTIEAEIEAIDSAQKGLDRREQDIDARESDLAATKAQNDTLSTELDQKEADLAAREAALQ